MKSFARSGPVRVTLKVIAEMFEISFIKKKKEEKEYSGKNEITDGIDITRTKSSIVPLYN